MLPLVLAVISVLQQPKWIFEHTYSCGMLHGVITVYEMTPGLFDARNVEILRGEERRLGCVYFFKITARGGKR